MFCGHMCPPRLGCSMPGVLSKRHLSSAYLTKTVRCQSMDIIVKKKKKRKPDPFSCLLTQKTDGCVLCFPIEGCIQALNHLAILLYGWGSNVALKETPLGIHVCLRQGRPFHSQNKPGTPFHLPHLGCSPNHLSSFPFTPSLGLLHVCSHKSQTDGCLLKCLMLSARLAPILSSISYMNQKSISRTGLQWWGQIWKPWGSLN